MFGRESQTTPYLASRNKYSKVESGLVSSYEYKNNIQPYCSIIHKKLFAEKIGPNNNFVIRQSG